LLIIVARVLLLIVEFNGKSSEYGIDLAVMAIASIIMGFLFVRDNKRAPTQSVVLSYIQTLSKKI
jgi:hypothetical protein